MVITHYSLEGPRGVLADDGVGVLRKFPELGHEPRVAGIAHGHAKVPQPAAILRALDRRLAKGAAEVFFRYGGQVSE